MPKKRQRVYSPRSRFLGVLCYYVIGVTFNRLGAFLFLPSCRAFSFKFRCQQTFVVPVPYPSFELFPVLMGQPKRGGGNKKK